MTDAVFTKERVNRLSTAVLTIKSALLVVVGIITLAVTGNVWINAARRDCSDKFVKVPHVAFLGLVTNADITEDVNYATVNATIVAIIGELIAVEPIVAEAIPNLELNS